MRSLSLSVTDSTIEILSELDTEEAKEKLAHFRYVPASGTYTEYGVQMSVEFYYREDNLPSGALHTDHDDKGNAIKEIHTDEEGNVETKEVEYKLVYIAAETSKEIDRLLEFIY